MHDFVYESLPGRVVFGVGAIARAGEEVLKLGRRVFLIHDPMAGDPAGAILAQLAGKADVRVWNEAIQHVPYDLAERARAVVDEHKPDVLVCLGGGSSTGLAKAIALSHNLPIVAIPTTYAGSEMTPIYGLTGDRHKQTGRSLQVLPKVVVYDPNLTLGLRPQVTGASAFNALAHSVESLYAEGANPVISAIALESVSAIHRSLAQVMAAPSDVDARSDLLYGAYLAGVCLGATSAAFHHRICHVLGGMYNLVHADAHSVILPHAVAYNAPYLPDDMARLATALGSPGGDPAALLWDLADRSGVPTSLAAIGLTAADLPPVAEQIAAEVKDNPAPVTVEGVLALLQAALEGRRPSSQPAAAARSR